MVQRFHRVLMVISVCGQLNAGSAFGHEMTDVLNAWENRSEKVSSWRVLIEADYTYGPTNNPLLAANSRLIGPDELPQEKSASPAEWELWLSGHNDPRFLFRRNAPKRSGETGGLWRVDSSVAYDGRQVAQVERWDGIKLNHGQIYDDESWARMALRNIEVKPIVMCLRALDEHAGGFRLADLKMSDRTGTVGKRTVPIIEARHGAEIWVDPDRAFSVIKYSSPRINMEIDYIRHATGMWIPSSWTISANSHYKMKVTLWDINSKLTDADFAISFPPDTLIRDYRQREVLNTYVDKRRQKKKISPEEASRLYVSSMGKVFPSLELSVSSDSKDDTP